MSHESHAYTLSSRHRQGDLVLSDGARLFTCTKEVLDGSRTTMLLITGLLRVDVLGSGDSVQVLMRNLTRSRLEGGPSSIQNRRATRFDGADQIIGEFVVEPAEGPVGSLEVMMGWPVERGERFTCTLAATLRRRES